MTRRTHIILILFLAVIFTSCKNEESKTVNNSLPGSVKLETLKIPDQGGRKLRGQVLYMPVYSNIPHLKKQDYSLRAFLAIHNTDLTYRIKITKDDYFDNDGNLIKNFISSDQQIHPLATKIFLIPKEDQSGAGANFLVEWIAEQAVNEPLIAGVEDGGPTPRYRRRSGLGR